MWTVKLREFENGKHEDAFPDATFKNYAEARAALEKRLGILAGSDEVYKDHWFSSDGHFPGVDAGATLYAKTNGWEAVSWDGTPVPKHDCWRKKFGRGYVSVGIGKFDSIVHSFGANSDSSFSSTRCRIGLGEYDLISEREAMAETDKWWRQSAFQSKLR